MTEYLNGLSVGAVTLGVVALVLFVVLVMVWVKAWNIPLNPPSRGEIL